MVCTLEYKLSIGHSPGNLAEDKNSWIVLTSSFFARQWKQFSKTTPSHQRKLDMVDQRRSDMVAL